MVIPARDVLPASLTEGAAVLLLAGGEVIEIERAGSSGRTAVCPVALARPTLASARPGTPQRPHVA